MSEKVFTLRMDEEIFNIVKNSADKNKRSVAKEIEFILEKHFTTENNLDAAERSEIFKQVWEDFLKNRK